jgi:hypothetical protein
LALFLFLTTKINNDVDDNNKEQQQYL